METTEPKKTGPMNGNDANEHADEHAGKRAGEHGGEEVIPHDLPKPGAKTIIALVAAFAILLIGLFLVGLIPGLKQEHEIRADAEECANDAPMVSTTRPVETPTSKDVILPADVKAFQDTSLFPRTSGYLKKWYVDIQDHVKEGQLLADIDTPEVDAELQQSKAALEQSKAAVDKAQSDLNLAQKTLDRYNEALRANKNAITEEDLDTKVAARDQAASALKQSKANVGSAEADVQRYTVMQGFEKIYAPISGIVTYRGFDNGALLTAGASGNAIFRLQQIDPLKVWVMVPQSYAQQIRTGQPAYLKVRNYGDKEFEGTVARTSASLDPSTRTMTFELHFPNSDGSLFPGMYGQARLAVTSPRPVMTVPASAMVFDSSGTRLAIVKDGKAHFQKITVGRDLGTELEVVDGVEKDDQVISNPGERLTEGTEVQISPPAQTQTAQQSSPPKNADGEKVAQKS